MHSHAHHHGPATGKVLKWSLIATFAFVALEVAAGLEARSLALLSDAGHNFTDCLALLLAWIGLYLQSKPADEIKTYGYHRTGVLAAFVNALALVVFSLWIFYEGWLRLLNPQPVAEWVMLAVACVGLTVLIVHVVGVRLVQPRVFVDMVTLLRVDRIRERMSPQRPRRSAGPASTRTDSTDARED